MQNLDMFRIETWDHADIDEFLQMYNDTFNLTEKLMKLTTAKTLVIGALSYWL